MNAEYINNMLPQYVSGRVSKYIDEYWENKLSQSEF